MNTWRNTQLGAVPSYKIAEAARKVAPHVTSEQVTAAVERIDWIRVPSAYDAGKAYEIRARIDDPLWRGLKPAIARELLSLVAGHEAATVIGKIDYADLVKDAIELKLDRGSGWYELSGTPLPNIRNVVDACQPIMDVGTLPAYTNGVGVAPTNVVMAGLYLASAGNWPGSVFAAPAFTHRVGRPGRSGEATVTFTVTGDEPRRVVENINTGAVDVMRWTAAKLYANELVGIEGQQIEVQASDILADRGVAMAGGRYPSKMTSAVYDSLDLLARLHVHVEAAYRPATGGKEPTKLMIDSPLLTSTLRQTFTYTDGTQKTGRGVTAGSWLHQLHNVLPQYTPSAQMLLTLNAGRQEMAKRIGWAVEVRGRVEARRQRAQRWKVGMLIRGAGIHPPRRGRDRYRERFESALDVLASNDGPLAAWSYVQSAPAMEGPWHDVWMGATVDVTLKSDYRASFGRAVQRVQSEEGESE